ncbi:MULTISPECIES: DoxX family protein [Nostocales]|uniref:DoxX family protein n=3 Tax=Nostocales TaxID=1161 RepID=A0A0C1QSH6_9CYAN|nr:DoxX family protein [Tolypothrix bouteillei]KAF3889813.1 DoxX family protein [Tolypothrix bouteillei VB521301]
MLKKYISLVARSSLSLIFLESGVNKILHPVATQEFMAAYGMPQTGFFLVSAILVELGAGSSVLLGYKARWGAIVLVLFLIAATLIFHTNFSDPMQLGQFMKNLAILGGLLMIVQYGPGAVSFDTRSNLSNSKSQIVRY